MSPSPPSACSFSGNSDMYGPGIRIGFYLQWFSEILASRTVHDEIPEMRLSNSLFTGATLIALVVQTAEDKLRPIEIYVILLLICESYLYLIPLNVWRIMKRQRPELEAGKLKDFGVLNRSLMVSAVVFQIWFWIRATKNVAGNKCEEFGFFFGKVRLHGRRFVAANFMLYYFLGWCCIIDLHVGIARVLKRISRKEDEEFLEARAPSLRRSQVLVDIAIAGTVVAAVELTIRWNTIENISNIPAVVSASQLIPIAIGVGLVLRALYVGVPGADNSKQKEKDMKTTSKSKLDTGTKSGGDLHPWTLENREINIEFERPRLSAYVPATPPRRFSEFDRPSPPIPFIATENQRQTFNPDFNVDRGTKAALQRDSPWESESEKSSFLERRRLSPEQSKSTTFIASSPPLPVRPKKSEFRVEVLPPDPVEKVPRQKRGARIWHKMKRSRATELEGAMGESFFSPTVTSREVFRVSNHGD